MQAKWIELDLGDSFWMIMIPSTTTKESMLFFGGQAKIKVHVWAMFV